MINSIHNLKIKRDNKNEIITVLENAEPKYVAQS